MSNSFSFTPLESDAKAASQASTWTIYNKTTSMNYGSIWTLCYWLTSSQPTYNFFLTLFHKTKWRMMGREGEESRGSDKYNMVHYADVKRGVIKTRKFYYYKIGFPQRDLFRYITVVKPDFAQYMLSIILYGYYIGKTFRKSTYLFLRTFFFLFYLVFNTQSLTGWQNVLFV